ncbi:MAG: hypothetical protein IPM58_10375 [Nitrospira sp.]|nr:hypothetical protein [Nitrospira sp.]
MPEFFPATPDEFHALKTEFRHHLDTFYAGLKLAPPYESVEKAVRTLTTTVHGLPIEEQTRVLTDPVLRWRQFQRAFEASGLSKKHRGIIAGLVRDRSAVSLPAEYDHFLEFFRLEGHGQSNG